MDPEQQKKKKGRKRTHTVTEPDITASEEQQQTPTAKKAKKATALCIKEIMSRYIDAERPGPKGNGGQKALPLLDELSRYVILKDPDEKDVGKEHWRCIAAEKGCGVYWTGHRQSNRVLLHAANCGYLPPELVARANEELASKSVNKRLDKYTKQAAEAREKIRQAQAHISSDSDDEPVILESNAKLTAPKSAAQLKAETRWHKAGREIRHLKHHSNIIDFIVAGGMAPSKADSPEWKALWRDADPTYTPPSSTSLVTSLLPQEAGRVREEIRKLLRDSRNEGFTLSFDGGTTRKVDSVYTIHITMADRRVFLWEGHESSSESHTGEKLYEVLHIVSTSLPSETDGNAPLPRFLSKLAQASFERLCRTTRAIHA